MSYLFKDGVFYNTAIHTNVPNGAKPVTDAKFAELREAANAGAKIQADANGNPVGVTQTLTGDALRATWIANAWQMREAANQLGYRDDIETAVAASTDIALRDAWNHWPSFARLHPKVILIGTTIGLTATELDDFFILAITLRP